MPAQFRFKRKAKRSGRFKSGLEKDFADGCRRLGLPFVYEADRIQYSRPSHYVPDWKIADGIYIETKGWLAPFQRANLIAFQEQYPDIRILLLFANASNRLSSKSKTTYGEWASRHGFEWADFRNGVPTHWWDKYAGKKQKNDRKKSRQEN